MQLGLMETGAGKQLEVKTAYSIFLFQRLHGFGIFFAVYICSVFLFFQLALSVLVCIWSVMAVELYHENSQSILLALILAAKRLSLSL